MEDKVAFSKRCFWQTINKVSLPLTTLSTQIIALSVYKQNIYEW